MLNKSVYLLVCLIEECAEVIQRACKAIRFGFDEIQPGQSLNNIERISGEMDDLLGVVRLLNTECNVYVLRQNETAIQNKMEKVQSFMPLSIERGTLEQEPKNQCECGNEKCPIPAHKCNGVDGAERHGFANRCTVCGRYSSQWHEGCK